MKLTEVWKICKNTDDVQTQSELEEIQFDVEKSKLRGQLMELYRSSSFRTSPTLLCLAYGIGATAALRAKDGQILRELDRYVEEVSTQEQSLAFALELAQDREIVEWMRKDAAKFVANDASEMELWLIVNIANGAFFGRRLEI